MDMKASMQKTDLMLRRGMPISRNDIYTLLQNCSENTDIGLCRETHCLLVFCGFASVVTLVDHCIRMFTLSGNLFEACLAFTGISEPSSYTWHAIILAHLKLGTLKRAFNLYFSMQCEAVEWNQVITLTMLKDCSTHNALCEGQILHHQVVTSGLDGDLAIGSALIDFYGKCGALVDSHRIFDQLSSKDLVVWNAMITVYAQHRRGYQTLRLFDKMQKEGFKPHVSTFSSVLRACSMLRDIDRGREVHAQVNRNNLEHDVVVGSALVDMYAKCSCLIEARDVFNKLPMKNVVVWNTIITGYAQEGLVYPALDLFIQMQCCDLKPDKITFLSLLKVCDGMQAFDEGQLIHNQVIEVGFDSDVAIMTTLVDMYAKLGALDDALHVFNVLPSPNIISWGALISGYAQQGQGFPALELYSRMCCDEVKPDRAMLLCLLKACASAGAMIQGKFIHDEVIRSDFESDVRFGSAIVDMYAKCGSLEEASNVFLQLSERDVVSWSVMIAAYAQFGHMALAEQCLKEMQKQGLRPDHGIFTSLLTAYSHACDIDGGLACFESMKDHGIRPKLEHYNCMIILLSHAGILNEAGELVQTMPSLPYTTEWTALLAACKTHGNFKLGSQCFAQTTKLEPNVAAGYVIMSSMYADSEMYEDVEKLKGVRKCGIVPVSSSIKINIEHAEGQFFYA